MKTNQLGNSELHLTELGLGTWAIGGGNWDYGWGEQEKSDSIKTIIRALELGINWIDTAAIYGFGKSEEIVGEAIKEWGEKVIVATKCGLIAEKNGSVSARLKKESIVKELEDSLKRLQLEQIDLYQIHWPRPDSDIEEALEAVLTLKEQGEIRCARISNFSRAQMKRLEKVGQFQSLQSPLSLVEQKVIGYELDWCKEREIGFLAYSPLQCGLLTGKVTQEWIDKLPENDWRKTKASHFQEPQLSEALEKVEKLKMLAEQQSASISQLAIKWVIDQPGVTSTIVGARRPEQIEETARAAKLGGFSWSKLG